jgi:hypothetical protein
VLVISEDLDELFLLCDRIAVMFEGRIMDVTAPSKRPVWNGWACSWPAYGRRHDRRYAGEPGSTTPVWLNVMLPLLAVGATLVLCSGLILLAGANVFTAYSKLFLSALSTRFNLVETAVKATPLVFTGLAVTVAFRAKFWNIGAEGQLLAGAMAAAFIGARVSLPAWSLVPSMILAGAVAGALWAMIPGVLKSRFKVDDVVTTLLLNFIIFYGMMALLDGPWKDPLSGYPDSPDIRMDAEFPILLQGHAASPGGPDGRRRRRGDVAADAPDHPGFRHPGRGGKPGGRPLRRHSA